MSLKIYPTHRPTQWSARETTLSTQLTLPVKITALSLFCPTGQDAAALAVEPTSGDVPNFKPRTMVPDRKNLKLMTHAVRLGVASIAMAVEQSDKWNSVPPQRRGMYVGASPQVGQHDDLAAAIEIAFQSGSFSMQDFGAYGIEKIHPLWLVRGLSNNVLGFASAHYDAQGHNMSYAMGEDGGWNAIIEGAYALVEGRLDIVVVGASDDLTGASEVLGQAGSAGAAFFVMERSETTMILDRSIYASYAEKYGLLGAAKIPVGLALHEFTQTKQAQ